MAVTFSGDSLTPSAFSSCTLANSHEFLDPCLPDPGSWGDCRSVTMSLWRPRCGGVAYRSWQLCCSQLSGVNAQLHKLWLVVTVLVHFTHFTSCASCDYNRAVADHWVFAPTRKFLWLNAPTETVLLSQPAFQTPKTFSKCSHSVCLSVLCVEVSATSRSLHTHTCKPDDSQEDSCISWSSHAMPDLLHAQHPQRHPAALSRALQIPATVLLHESV